MKRPSWRTVVDYVFITLGAFVMAVGLGVFLVDAKVVAGGVSGLSMAVYYLSDGRIPVGILIWVLNIPLFIWGVRELGRSFGVRTFWGLTSNAFFVDLLRGAYVRDLRVQDWEAVRYLLEHDFFFSVLLGAVLMGLGLGTVFKFKGTTAGSDIVAAVASRRWKVKPGTIFLLTDFFVISFAGIVIHQKGLSPDRPAAVLVLYAFLLLFVSSQLVDMVLFGFDYAKSAFIVSDRSKEIAARIMGTLSRGATALHGRGLYRGVERDILFTVVGRREIHRITEIVNEIDPHAFVIITNVYEVLGEGFKPRGEVDLDAISITKKLKAKEPSGDKAGDKPADKAI